MKVCLLNDSFPPLIDGVANAVVNYARVLTEKYDGAVVATPRYPGVTDAYSFPVVRYPSLNTTRMVGYRSGIPFSPEAALRIEKEQVGLLHSHCPVASTLFARSLRDLLDIPLILTYHTKFDIDIANLVRSGMVQKSAIRLMVHNISACDEVWAVSRGAADNLHSLGYEGNCVMMKNGVDFPRGRVSADRAAEARLRLGADADKPLFLFVGRMMWYKGLRLMLDALSRLRAQGEAFHMAFIGDGADRDAVEEYAAALGLGRFCTFAGAIRDRELLRACFCAADVFLFPSTFDTNGLVVREAAACSLPSMIVRGSCAAEGITDEKNGLLIDETPESMAARLLWACQNPDGCRKIGRQAAADIYVSWEDAVACAWDRYAVVCENYRAGQKAPRGVWTREFFRAADEVAEGLHRLREIGGHRGEDDRYL